MHFCLPKNPGGVVCKLNTAECSVCFEIRANCEVISDNFITMTAKREETMFVSAYGLFFRETQAVIKSQNPGASYCEISKKVANMWDGLDLEHKNVYKSKAESSKNEYIGALTAYRTSLESKSIPTVLTGGEDQKKSPSTMVSTAVHHKTDHNQINTLFKKPLSKHTNREQVSQQAQVQKVIPVAISPSPLVVVDSVQQQQKPLTENEQMNQPNVCIRQGCSNLAVSNPEWENEYCSTDCVLSHCREVYNNWVKLRRDKTNNFSSRK